MRYYALMFCLVTVACSTYHSDDLVEPAPIVHHNVVANKPYVQPEIQESDVWEEEEVKFSPKEEKKAKIQTSIQELERKKRARTLDKSEVEQLKKKRQEETIVYKEEPDEDNIDDED